MIAFRSAAQKKWQVGFHIGAAMLVVCAAPLLIAQVSPTKVSPTNRSNNEEVTRDSTTLASRKKLKKRSNKVESSQPGAAKLFMLPEGRSVYFLPQHAAKPKSTPEAENASNVRANANRRPTELAKLPAKGPTQMDAAREVRFQGKQTSSLRSNNHVTGANEATLIPPNALPLPDLDADRAENAQTTLLRPTSSSSPDQFSNGSHFRPLRATFTGIKSIAQPSQQASEPNIEYKNDDAEVESLGQVEDPIRQHSTELVEPGAIESVELPEMPADLPQVVIESDTNDVERTQLPPNARAQNPFPDPQFSDGFGGLYSEEIPRPLSLLDSRPTPAMANRVGSEQIDIDSVARKIKQEQLIATQESVALDLQTVLALALAHSKNLQVLRIQSAETQQDVQTEFGQFDWTGFVESAFSQDSQPVGSVGQTNLNIDQVRNDNNTVTFGVRKQTVYGGQIELSETLGTRDTNSGLLDPAEPGNAQIAITFSQELLRDGGRDIVLSQALIASLSADQVHAQSYAEISNLLRDVLVQYWDLYRRRGDFFIQQSLIEWAEHTLRLLENRGKIDAEANSIEQARALLQEARANLENARAAVLISQDRLYRLVNAPQIDSNKFELLTTESPKPSGLTLELLPEFQQALTYRSEVVEKLTEIRAAAVAHHVSLNQLLPRLTFSIESSLNGLDENRDFWGAKRNMSDIDPSYAANLNFEIRLGNRTARAQNKRAQITLRRLQFEYEDQLEEIRLDVATALRTINASTAILDQRRKTLQARQEEIDYLRVRRDVIPQQGVSPSLLLEQFFQAINRLVVSQQAYVAAVSDQQAAFAQLLQAKGLLLNVSEVPRDMNVGVPNLRDAWQLNRNGKDQYIRSAKQRVVIPGRQDNPISRHRGLR